MCYHAICHTYTYTSTIKRGFAWFLLVLHLVIFTSPSALTSRKTILIPIPIKINNNERKNWFATQPLANKRKMELTYSNHLLMGHQRPLTINHSMQTILHHTRHWILNHANRTTCIKSNSCGGPISYEHFIMYIFKISIKTHRNDLSHKFNIKASKHFWSLFIHD